MNSIVISTVVLPGVVALLLFLVFTYLHEQSRQPYFRAWQFAWSAYTLHFALEAVSKFWPGSAVPAFLGSLLLVVMALCILVSTRLTRRLTSSERSEAFRLRWFEISVAFATTALTFLSLKPQLLGSLPPGITRYLRLDIGLAAVLGYSSFHFYLTARRRGSLAFWLLAIFLAFWTVMMLFEQMRSPFSAVPQMLLGIA